MGAKNSNKPSYSRELFGDRLDYGTAVRARFGVDFDSVQLSPGPGPYHMETFACAEKGLWVARTRLTQWEYSAFEIPNDHVLISFCKNRSPFYCNGLKMSSSPLILFPPGKRIEGVFPSDWEGFDILANLVTGEELGLFPDEFEPRLAEREILISDTLDRSAREFVDRLADFYYSAEMTHDVNHRSAIAHEAIEHIVQHLRTVIARQLEGDRDHRVIEIRRPDVLTRAIKYIDDNITEEIGAEDIARATGVSYRLLNYVFKEAVGVSPYQFVLDKKLHAVRRALKTSDSSVSQIAARFGFSTPSRFRRQYHRLFGELPSRTRALTSRA